MPPDSRTGIAFAALLASCVLLAFGPWLVRLADVGPIASGFWRLALAAPILVALAARGGRGAIAAVPRAMWAGLAVGGLFFAADLGSWHVGILHTRLANATLFGNSASLFFAAYGFLVARRLPGGTQAIALVLAAAGMTLLMGRSYELSSRNLMGDALCLLAGLFYTGYLIAIDRVRGRVRPWPALAISTCAGLAPLLGLALVAGGPVLPHHWGPLLLLALGSQVAGQGLMVFAVLHLPPLVVGLGLLTQPVVAAGIGWFAYGERLAAPDLAGAALIAVALVLVRRRPGGGASGAASA